MRQRDPHPGSIASAVSESAGGLCRCRMQETIEVAKHGRSGTPDEELSALMCRTAVRHGVELHSAAHEALRVGHHSPLVIGRIHQKRQRDTENLGHLGSVRNKGRMIGFNTPNHRRHPKARDRHIVWQSPEQSHAIRLQTNFFLCLPQSSRFLGEVRSLRAPPGKTDLPGMRGKMAGALRKHHGWTIISRQRKQDGCGNLLLVILRSEAPPIMCQLRQPLGESGTAARQVKKALEPIEGERLLRNR